MTDITRDAVARALYLHGPAGIATIAADLERRALPPVNLPELLVAMVSSGKASRRQVAIAGQVVDLFYLAGNGVG